MLGAAAMSGTALPVAGRAEQTQTSLPRLNFMHGHAPDGEALPVVPTGPVIVGSGGLYSTPNDLMRWMKWHLDRFGKDGAEARILDHALYVMRDGLEVASGMDESGHMDGLGLAWIGMMAGRIPRSFSRRRAGFRAPSAISP